MGVLGPVVILTVANASSVRAASPASGVRPPGWECRWCPSPKRLSGEAEAGVGSVSDSAFKFGEYRGLEEQGAYGVGGVKGRYRNQSQRLDVRTSDLGLTTRRVEIDGGVQGRYRLGLIYDRLPRFDQDTAQSPFRGTGSEALTLPGGWVNADSTSGMTTLGANLRKVDLEQERRRFGARFSLVPRKGWELRAAFSHEFKDGTKSIGGAVGSSFGATRTAILPEPVDYETDQVEVAAAYSWRRFQAELGYRGSFFNNENESLTWRNPFAGEGEPGAVGRLALPPDNRFHQIFASLGYDLPARTRVSARVAFGRMNQDESLLTFAVDPDLDRPLPRDSLDGEVQTRLVNLKLSSRPWRGLSLNAQYRLEDRDNDTPQDLYTYVVADSAPSVAGRTNLPYSFKRHLVSVKGGYAFARHLNASAGFDYQRMDRTFQEIGETREKTFWAKLVSRPHRLLDVMAKFAHAERDPSSFDPVTEVTPSQNPLLRKFFLAERDRNETRIRLVATPSTRWSVGVSGDFAHDDYGQSVIGLKDEKDFGLTLDLSFSPWERLSTYAFYTRQWIKAKQAGSRSFSKPDLSGRTADIFDTLGVGIKVIAIPNRLDVRANYVYAASEGSIEVTGAGSGFPDLDTSRHTFDVHANYRLRQNLGLRLGFLYERFRSDQWPIDGVGPASLPNVLSLGEQSHNYSVSVFSFSVVYQFQ
ncbi:MAG: MtrB/PioB family decaheme-associated outer membrane protein [Methylohalobius sp. ZOD2]